MFLSALRLKAHGRQSTTIARSGREPHFPVAHHAPAQYSGTSGSPLFQPAAAGILARASARPVCHRESVSPFLDPHVLPLIARSWIGAGQLPEDRLLPARDYLRPRPNPPSGKPHGSLLSEGRFPALGRAADQRVPDHFVDG